MPAKTKWDTKSSTFYWSIQLDPSHPKNTISLLTGYSKVEGQAESSDKETMLKRKIINLYTNGYFARMRQINIFQNTGVFIDKSLDPCIIQLFPKHYNIDPANHQAVYKRYGAFLEDFYQRINANKSLDNILPQTRRIRSQDQFLDINAYSFKGPANLYSHAARLLLHGHAEGAVNHFIDSYKKKMQWK